MPLQPGQRLKVITEIAPVLAAKSWTEVNIHLRQFGLPWRDTWRGEMDSYVMTQLERGDDDALLGLHAYLFPRDAAATTEGHWTPRYFRVFMSHISADKAFGIGHEDGAEPVRHRPSRPPSRGR